MQLVMTKSTTIPESIDDWFGNYYHLMNNTRLLLYYSITDIVRFVLIVDRFLFYYIITPIDTPFKMST